MGINLYTCHWNVIQLYFSKILIFYRRGLCGSLWPTPIKMFIKNVLVQDCFKIKNHNNCLYLLIAKKCNLWRIHLCSCRWRWEIYQREFVLTIFKSLPTSIPLVISSTTSRSKWLLTVTASMWHNLHMVDSLWSWGKFVSAQKAPATTTEIEQLKNVALYNC